MLIKKISLITGNLNEMEIPVTIEQLNDWKNSDMLIQDKFPYLTADEREFLLTGSTPQEWDEAFSDEDE